MNLYAFPPLLSSLLFAALGAFVILNNNSRINRSFFLSCVATFVWQFTWFIQFSLNSIQLAPLLVKVGYSGIIFIPITLYDFYISLLDYKKDNWKVLFAYALGGVFLIFNWSSDLFISGFLHFRWGFYPKAGILHPAYLAMLVILDLRVLYLLVKALVNEQNYIKKMQFIYILAGLLCYSFASVDFIVNYGINLYPFGFIFILATLSLTAYAITRYRLMDIQVIIRKGAYYSALSIIMSVLYIIIINFSEVVFHSATGLNSLWFVIPAIFFLALIFQPLSDHLKEMIDKRFFRAKYESERIAKKFSAGINKLMSARDFAKYITRVTHNTFKLKGTACFVIDDDGISYRCLHAEGTFRTLQDTVIGKASVLVEEMKAKSNAVILSELLYSAAQSTDPQKQSALIDGMKARRFALLVPSISAKRDVKLLGFLATDEKANSDVFSSDEITLLETLSNQTVAGIENSLFYKDQIKRTEIALALEKQASLGQATAGVAHETKNALGYIIGFSQLLPSCVDKKEFMDTAVRAFPTEVERMKVILSGIIDYSKDEVQNKERVQVKKLVDDTIVLVRDRAKGANVMIETNVDPSHHIFADPNRLRQVLLNLFMNSLDAMPGGGGILKAFSDSHKGNVYIKVSDTGSGMPPEVVKKIFEPFFTTKEQGTGLGLAIVKKIIEENRGNLYVETKEGEGTTFVIEMPEPALVAA